MTSPVTSKGVGRFRLGWVAEGQVVCEIWDTGPISETGKQMGPQEYRPDPWVATSVGPTDILGSGAPPASGGESPPPGLDPPQSACRTARTKARRAKEKRGYPPPFRNGPSGT